MFDHGNLTCEPFILQPVSQLKDLNLDGALAVMLEDLAVGLPLVMLLDLVVVFGVGRGLVAWLEKREIALDVAGGTATTRRRKADVGGHGCGVDGVTLARRFEVRRTRQLQGIS